MDNSLPHSGEIKPDLPVLPQKTKPAVAAENRLAASAWPIKFELCGTKVAAKVADETPTDLDQFIRVALRVDQQPAALFIPPLLSLPTMQMMRAL